MTHVIDGRAIAAILNEQTAGSAARLRARGVIPALAVVMPADDGSAARYARSIERAAARTGIECRIHGKPAALLLLAQDATVTICHSRTRDLPAVCREADVLVVAAGQPLLVGAGHVAPGAVVIDVGINPAGRGGLVGDVDARAVTGIASAITPVPGGVGPVTTAQLMSHTIQAAHSERAIA